MQNLFYSEQEKILFWIAGYCRDLNTDNVVEKMQSLRENANRLANIINTDIGKVCTYEILKSQRYKNMRVFYVRDVEQVPMDAFRIGGTREDGTISDWTMSKWIHD